jgi:predicted enzyme related to lactoylglutathione lyase
LWLQPREGNKIASDPIREFAGLAGGTVSVFAKGHARRTMIWIHVADLGETLERVTAHGGEIVEPPAPDGPTRIGATIIDPEGNPVGLASHASP